MKKILEVTVIQDGTKLLGHVKTDGGIINVADGAGDIFAEIIRVLSKDSNGLYSKSEMLSYILDRVQNNLIND